VIHAFFDVPSCFVYGSRISAVVKFVWLETCFESGIFHVPAATFLHDKTMLMLSHRLGCNLEDSDFNYSLYLMLCVSVDL